MTFKPHRFNIPRGKELTISLADIVGVRKTESAFGLSKEIWIHVRDGRLEHFVVWGRDELIDEINRQLKKAEIVKEN